ncbi:MAG: biotin transporter BioY [Thermacetogeniaceae bacterium]
MDSKRLPLRGMVFASLFGAVTALGAYISIPLQPVPITMQTLFVGLSGALLGGLFGAISQVVYVLLGVIGLPVFAGGTAGPGILLGPSGGYLFGFIAGAFVVGKLLEIKKDPGLIWIIFSLVAGTIVIYGFGLLQLSLVARLSLLKALLVGAAPFWPGDLLKTIAAALIILKVRHKINLPGAKRDL